MGMIFFFFGGGLACQRPDHKLQSSIILVLVLHLSLFCVDIMAFMAATL